MKKPLPPTYLLIALVAIAALHVVAPGPQLLHTPWRYLGLLPLGLGIWVNFWADALFKRAQTEIRPFRDSTTLVTTGPYSISRHPMYLGMVAIALGAALAAGSSLPLAVPIVLWWLLTAHFAGPEEAELHRQFGVQYDEYAHHVRRWIGRRAA